MIVPVLLLILTVGAIVLVARARRLPAASPVPAPPARARRAAHLGRRARDPRALEAAHASVAGALALTATGAAHGRPGHRCIEEVRRRSNEDFVGAMNFLEGQLNRRVSEDPAEQARYWIDVAEGLRGLNMHEALPALLRRADDALDLPLAELYAAEVVGFPSFSEYMHDPLTPEGQAALRVLRVAMEAVRLGRVPTSLYSEAAFGDAARRLAENCPGSVNPRLALAFIEAMRHCRRTFHTAPAFRDDAVRRQTVRWQHAFLLDAEPVMREYLHDIGPDLTRLLGATHGRARLDVLRALDELQSDTGGAALALLGEAEFEHRPAAIACLRWAKSPPSLSALTGLARHAITGGRSARWLRRLGVGSEMVPVDEVLAALRALRGHPSEEAEKVLLLYAGRPEPEWRLTAVQSLGWWEPTRRSEVIALLRDARQDVHPDVRRAALAAAARLGECAALQLIRETMGRDNPVPVLDAIRLCAAEGLSWLWPDLDVLTESDDAAIAAEAWEAIERLREEFLGPLA